MKKAQAPLSIVILGLSITSSWGNGHATTYRGLVRELDRRGHHVTFLERDVPWYRDNRDLPRPPFGRTCLYRSLAALQRRFTSVVRDADLTIVGSFVPQGIEVGEWVLRAARGATAFYDIDTPETLRRIEANGADYISPSLLRRYDLYLSFTGGPLLERLERRYGARRARALFCSVDASLYRPQEGEQRWDLGYLGTYSEDRQPALNRLLSEPARLWPRGRFAVVGAQYPEHIAWPGNVERLNHLPPDRHPGFYAAQRFTLNVTRAAMRRAGWSPSVRLFEAASCATPVISDLWSGIDHFFAPEREILLARTASEVMRFLRELPESERCAIGRRARQKVLRYHTAAHRAHELETYALEVLGRTQTHTPPPSAIEIRAVDGA